MSDRLQELALFVRVADCGSFSRAGREVGMAQPTVSRMIAALEARLGVRLLMRTTRRVTLTEAGTALLARARTALGELEEAEAEARGTAGLTGVLRVATPVTYGAREIVPRLGPFLAAQPSLRMELLMADRRVDLLEEGVDVAIRLGPLEDSSFVSRRLASAPRVLVASPAYVARRGAPATPSDLEAHDIILGRSPGRDVWSLQQSDGTETTVKLGARLVATSIEGLLAAAAAGLGIAATSLFACRAELEQGALVRVLDAWSLAPVEVHAVVPTGRRSPTKVRAFIDFLASQLSG
jgi:DNA-binding transcriptional LysR family regulator